MSHKKPWCAYGGDVACDCPRDECVALKNQAMLDHMNALLGYGLSLKETADDIKASGQEFKF